MNNWRDLILNEFAPGIARLTIVSDPDGILLDEEILQEIRKREFSLVTFEDKISFRYAYESKFRSHWEIGEKTDLVVVLRSDESNIKSLPYDLIRAGRILSFDLCEIFPDLSYSVISKLDRIYYERLYSAQIKNPHGSLGENATKDYILLHVFEVTFELIRNKLDLLRILLRRHYRGESVPTIVDDRFIHVLRQSGEFDDWPLESIVPCGEAFFEFLQENWPKYLDTMVGKEMNREEGSNTSISSLNIPFGDDDVRIYLDNLFLEGILKPVPHSEDLAKTWMSIGIQCDSRNISRDRIMKLIKSVESKMPDIDSRYQVWLDFAKIWAELIYQYHKDDNEIKETIEALKKKIDESFTSWLKNRFSGLINQPPKPPVMLHHINRSLAYQVDNKKKVALLVVDGLSLDQWITIREGLVHKQSNLRFQESTVFAWVPTLTSVSRQAIFAGTCPQYFPNSIDRTDREPALWSKFWMDQGISNNEIVYLKNLGDGNIDDVKEKLPYHRIKVVGFVVDKVDRIMHGMELGTAGMHNQLRQWTKNGYISDLVNYLLDREFDVYLTSDHGNVEATGIGRPDEGAVADLRGERVRVYQDANLRKQVKKQFPKAHEWEPIGLPDSYLPLIAPERRAFVLEGKTTVCHGGISLEEVVVPFIKIERKKHES